MMTVRLRVSLLELKLLSSEQRGKLLQPLTFSSVNHTGGSELLRVRIYVLLKSKQWCEQVYHV